VGYEIVVWTQIGPKSKPLPKNDTIPKNIKLLQRVHLDIDDQSQLYALNPTSTLLTTFDLVSVQPLNEKMFQHTCSTLEVDIITIDCSQKLPYMLKIPQVHQAIERGIFFELTYSAGLQDQSARRYLFSNALALVRSTRGKNIIISSKAKKIMDMRSPYDIINLATLFGISVDVAKNCVSSNCVSALYHAETRRTQKCVLNTTPLESGILKFDEPPISKKRENKRRTKRKQAGKPGKDLVVGIKELELAKGKRKLGNAPEEQPPAKKALSDVEKTDEEKMEDIDESDSDE